MKNLSQEQYEDQDGKPFPADKIDCITPYSTPIDGFFHSECAKCGENISSRHFRFFGVVLKCSKCGAHNLLVRTDVIWVHEQILKGRTLEVDLQELERLKGIEKYNEDQIKSMKYKLSSQLESFIRQLKI